MNIILNANSPKKSFLYFGLFLILCGVLGYASNPEKAATALISGGGFGSLFVILSLLWSKNPKLFRIIGTAFTHLLALTFAWRSSVSWQSVAQGNTEKTFAAALISAMLLAALAQIVVLVKSKQTSGQSS